MKKNFMMIALASVLMMPVSCTKNEMNAPEDKAPSYDFDLKEMTFDAVPEDGATKTSIDLGTGDVSWNEGDAIKLVWELSKNVGSSTSETLTAENIVEGTASFSVEAPADFENETTEETSRHMYAVYPSTLEVDYSNGSSLYVTVPDVQDGSFANASIALAKWYYGKPLAFKNLCGLVQVVVADEAVRKIVLEANTDIAGKVDVGGFDGGVVNVKSVKEGKKTITVNVNGAGTYYIAVLPSSLEGFYMALYDENDELVGDNFSENTLTVARKQIRKLGTLKTGFADRLYVKADGTGDGSSWDNATDVKGMLAVMQSSAKVVKNIYVAAGNYTIAAQTVKPATGSVIKIYGGYSKESTGTAISGRNLTENVSVIQNLANRLFYTYSGNWVFDGLHFTSKGYNGSAFGCLLFIDGTESVVLNKCTFSGTENNSSAAGGVVRVDTEVTFNDCTFSDNTSSGVCGGIYVTAKGKLNLNNCTFKSNTATKSGGAIVSLGQVNAVNCDFTSNSAGVSAGAVYMSGSGEFKANLCIFSLNESKGSGSSDGGGAIWATENSKVYLNRCFMANNIDGYNAYHIYSGANTHIGLNNCVVRGPYGKTNSQGSLLQIKGSTVVVNTTLYCQIGTWGAISLGSKTENGCRVINDIIINNSGSSYSFYSTSYFMQVYNTIYSANRATDASYGQTFTDCLGGAVNKSETQGDAKNLFPNTTNGWTQKSLGTQFDLSKDRHIYVYDWDGTTTVGQVTKTSLADIKTLISGTANNVGADFLSWLESDALKVNGVEALAVDIRGVARNTDAMWPGSYEDAAVASNAENLNVR